MTSNAKIGLLIGLTIIFLIVFVINGMSGFDNTRDKVDIPVVFINPPGIRPNIRPEDFPSGQVPDQQHTEETQPVDKGHLQVTLPKTTPPDDTNDYTEPAEQAWPKVYIVCQGDNLAGIAKKFYGPEEGNRRVNVQRIFEANRESLESADKIYPGQKLVIPSLQAFVQDKNGMDGIFPESMFEKVESIGRRHL